MFPTHPEFPEIALQHQRALLEEAARARLIRQSRAARPGHTRSPLRAIRITLASALYALASWLDDREVTPPTPSEPLLQW